MNSKSTTTTLVRDLRVGECVSFDGGRIKVFLREKSGRAARLQFEVPEAVGIDKPRQAANDEVRAQATPLDSQPL